jgi:PAS domain S-box-containing protein
MTEAVKTGFLPKKALRILHLEDDPRDAELVETILQDQGLQCDITCVKTRQDFESILAEQNFDLILSDYGLPGYDGFAALNAVRTKDRNVPFILLSGTLGEEQAVESLKSGATDYLLKNRLERLVPAVTRALREAQERAIRRKTEEALAKEREFIKAVLENIQSGIVACDAEGTLTLLNRAMREMHGAVALEQVPAEQIAERYNLFHPDGKTLLKKEELPLFRALNGERVQDVEIKIVPKIGGPRIVLCSGQPILDGQGKKLGAVVATHDITDRRKAEEETRQLENQLRQAQKLEAIGTLAGGIAHDFNNILGAIIGYAELAHEDIPATSRSRKHLQEVLKAGHRAKELVHQILAFSRQTIPERRPVAISLIIKEAIKLLRASLPSTIQMRTEIKTRSDRAVADPVQIHQVLMNLCTNAGHAMREKGGILTVRLDELTVGETKSPAKIQPGAYLRLVVADTGHGMDKAIQERIFDPFFTTKPLGEGTGLGLSVVHGIVTSHGGQISVSSEVGVGTTFEILLPQAANVVELTPKSAARAAGGTERILLVDDEEPLANLLYERLERHGYKVVAQTDSLSAFELFAAAPSAFDVVVSDQTMPRLTGVDLAKQIRRVRGDIPIFICTGYSENVKQEDVQAIGLCEVVLKPVDLEALNAAIRRVLDHKHAVAC